MNHRLHAPAVLLTISLSACGTGPAPERIPPPVKSEQVQGQKPTDSHTTPDTGSEPNWPDGLPPHLMREAEANRGLSEIAMDSRIFAEGKYNLDHTLITTFDEHGEPLTRRAETPARKVTSNWTFTYEQPHLPATVVYTSADKKTERTMQHQRNAQGRLTQTTAKSEKQTIVETYTPLAGGTYRVNREVTEAGDTKNLGHDIYDSKGLHTQHCPSQKPCITYRYDPHDNLLAEQEAGGEETTYEVEVDSQGRELRRVEGRVTYTFQYDDKGRLLERHRENNGKRYEQRTYRYTERVTP